MTEGRTGIPAPWSGLDAWIPAIPATPHHSLHTPSFRLPPVIPVKTGIHASAPVIPATPRHSCPPVIPVKTGIHASAPAIPATLATPRPFPLPRESFTRPRCTGPPIPD